MRHNRQRGSEFATLSLQQHKYEFGDIVDGVVVAVVGVVVIDGGDGGGGDGGGGGGGGGGEDIFFLFVCVCVW